MALYLFENPETGEVKEIVMTMKEPHVYFVNGVEWKRIFSVPQTSIDSRWDAMSPKDFSQKTGKKKGTLGDLFDKSAELSEKREKIMGKDTIQEKYFSDYAKERKGKEHPDARKKRLKEKLKGNKMFTLEL